MKKLFLIFAILLLHSSGEWVDEPDNILGNIELPETHNTEIKIIAPLFEYKITSECGIRRNPLPASGGAESQLHRGIDILGEHECFVMAAAEGEVIECWPAPNSYYGGHPIYGGYIVIEHFKGFYTAYAHLSIVYVREGMMVKQGMIIGRQGNNGLSTGEHCHFELIIDPLSVINGEIKIERTINGY